MIEAARHETAWRDQHLEARLFDTASSDAALLLTAENFEAVAYATTRMMHAWHIPASIAGEAYVDASYTCQFPAVEMAERGFDAVLAIATEPGPVARDLFGTPLVPAEWNGVPVTMVSPARDLKEIGVDFQHATAEGLERAFAEGQAAAQAVLAG